jgi:hypothetical protein
MARKKKPKRGRKKDNLIARIRRQLKKRKKLNALEKKLGLRK